MTTTAALNRVSPAPARRRPAAKKRVSPAPKGTVLASLKQRHSPNYSSRNGTRVDLLVYHESAGHYAGDISWLCTPTVVDAHGRVLSGPDASATAVVREDGGETTQLVPMHLKAWAQGDFNSRAVGIEHSNMTAKGFNSEPQLRESARLFAWLCWKLGIPVRIARGGHGPGICRHLDLGQAGGGHTQCGMGDHDFERWMQMIADEHTRGGFRPVYFE